MMLGSGAAPMAIQAPPGGEGEREPQHQVRGPGKTLGPRVPQQHHQHRGREEQRPRSERAAAAPTKTTDDPMVRASAEAR